MYKKLSFHQYSGHQFPLAILKFPQGPIELHTHSFEELVIIESGHGTHFTKNESYEILAGDVFVIRKGKEHGYKDTSNLRLVNVLFKIKDLSLPEQEIRKVPGYHALFRLEPEFRWRHHFESRLRLTPDELAITSGILNNIQRELKGEIPGFEFMATAYFMELAGFLSRCYSKMRGRVHAPIIKLGEVISYLERHYSESMSLESLCKMACMSRSTFFRNFSRATGLSPIDYLIRLRISQASKHLREGKTSIKEVAARTGFRDSNYFSRQYRKFMNETPCETRRKTES